MNLEYWEEDWESELSWAELVPVLQRHPPPPQARGTTPPPLVAVDRPLLFRPVPMLPQNKMRVVMDTSAVSLLLDGYTLRTNAPKFFGYFPGLRQVVGDVGASNMMAVPKIHRSLYVYNWYQSRDQRAPVAEVSITKTVHAELMNAPQVIPYFF